MYKPLQKDPRWDVEKQILSVLKPALDNGIIDSDLFKFLHEKHPTTPALYLLPKIHKTLNNPPGHPIVLGRGSILNKMYIFLDKVLCEYAIQSGSYIKDMSDSDTGGLHFGILRCH